MIIPNDSTVAVSCRANTGPVHRQTPVFFEPDKLAQLLPEGLEVKRSLLNIKPGKTPVYKLLCTMGQIMTSHLRAAPR